MNDNDVAQRLVQAAANRILRRFHEALRRDAEERIERHMWAKRN